MVLISRLKYNDIEQYTLLYVEYIKGGNYYLTIIEKAEDNEYKAITDNYKCISIEDVKLFFTEI